MNAISEIKEEGKILNASIKPGSHVSEAIEDCIKLAKEKSKGVVFEFSGIIRSVTVCVKHDSSLSLIWRDFRRASNGELGSKPVVGPYPREKLDAVYLAWERKQYRNEV